MKLGENGFLQVFCTSFLLSSHLFRPPDFVDPFDLVRIPGFVEPPYFAEPPDFGEWRTFEIGFLERPVHRVDPGDINGDD